MSEADYRGGCRPYLSAETPGCGRRCAHREIVQEFRDAWDAWRALRESDTPADVAGGAGALISAYQLEEEDFRAAFPPPPTFPEWLKQRARPRE